MNNKILTYNILILELKLDPYNQQQNTETYMHEITKMNEKYEDT
jgi:hypothetical protein